MEIVGSFCDGFLDIDLSKLKDGKCCYPYHLISYYLYKEKIYNNDCMRYEYYEQFKYLSRISSVDKLIAKNRDKMKKKTILSIPQKIHLTRQHRRMFSETKQNISKTLKEKSRQIKQEHIISDKSPNNKSILSKTNEKPVKNTHQRTKKSWSEIYTERRKSRRLSNLPPLDIKIEIKSEEIWESFDSYDLFTNNVPVKELNQAIFNNTESVNLEQDRNVYQIKNSPSNESYTTIDPQDNNLDEFQNENIEKYDQTFNYKCPSSATNKVKKNVFLQPIKNSNNSNTTENTTENTPENTTEYTTEYTTENTIDITTENTIDITIENTIDITTENTIDITTENTIDITTENITENTTENTIDITTENTTEDTTENTIVLENIPKVNLIVTENSFKDTNDSNTIEILEKSENVPEITKFFEPNDSSNYIISHAHKNIDDEVIKPIILKCWSFNTSDGQTDITDKLTKSKTALPQSETYCNKTQTQEVQILQKNYCKSNTINIKTSTSSKIHCENTTTDKSTVQRKDHNTIKMKKCTKKEIDYSKMTLIEKKLYRKKLSFVSALGLVLKKELEKKIIEKNNEAYLITEKSPYFSKISTTANERACNETSSDNVRCSYLLKYENESTLNDKTQKHIAIPILIRQNTSGSSFHPERTCMHKCSSCQRKFKSLDIPCHMAQIKNPNKQKACLENTSHLIGPTSCLCSSCFKEIEKRSSVTNEDDIGNNCTIMNCSVTSCHVLKTEFLRKISTLLNQKGIVLRQWLVELQTVGICNSHYDQILDISKCQFCGNRTTLKYDLQKSELHAFQAVFDKDGVPVTVNENLFVCYPCRMYFLWRVCKRTPNNNINFTKLRDTIFTRICAFHQIIEPKNLFENIDIESLEKEFNIKVPNIGNEVEIQPDINKFLISKPVQPETEKSFELIQPVTRENIVSLVPTQSFTNKNISSLQPIEPITNKSILPLKPIRPNTDKNILPLRPIRPNTDKIILPIRPIRPNTDKNTLPLKPIRPNTDKNIFSLKPIQPITSKNIYSLKPVESVTPKTIEGTGLVMISSLRPVKKDCIPKCPTIRKEVNNDKRTILKPPIFVPVLKPVNSSQYQAPTILPSSTHILKSFQHRQPVSNKSNLLQPSMISSTVVRQPRRNSTVKPLTQKIFLNNGTLRLFRNLQLPYQYSKELLNHLLVLEKYRAQGYLLKMNNTASRIKTKSNNSQSSVINDGNFRRFQHLPNSLMTRNLRGIAQNNIKQLRNDCVLNKSLHKDEIKKPLLISKDPICKNNKNLNIKINKVRSLYTKQPVVITKNPKATPIATASSSTITSMHTIKNTINRVNEKCLAVYSHTNDASKTCVIINKKPPVVITSVGDGSSMTTYSSNSMNIVCNKNIVVKEMNSDKQLCVLNSLATSTKIFTISNAKSLFSSNNLFWKNSTVNDEVPAVTVRSKSGKILNMQQLQSAIASGTKVIYEKTKT